MLLGPISTGLPFSKLILSLLHISPPKWEATIDQVTPIGPTRAPFRPLDQGTAANIHTQPLKVSTTAVSSQDVPIIATQASIQSQSTAKSVPINCWKDESDVENGSLTSEGGAYAFEISERNTVAATGRACIVM